MIIDTHCHIYNSEMENAEEIIKEAQKNNIILILNGTDLESNEEALKLSEDYENVYAALGYFYTLADEITDEDILLLDNQLKKDKVIAVGEIGLDYYKGKVLELREHHHDVPLGHPVYLIGLTEDQYSELWYYHQNHQRMKIKEFAESVI